MKIKNVTNNIITISKQNIATAFDAAMLTRDISLLPGAELVLYDFVAEGLPSLRKQIDDGVCEIVNDDQPPYAPSVGIPGVDTGGGSGAGPKTWQVVSEQTLLVDSPAFATLSGLNLATDGIYRLIMVASMNGNSVYAKLFFNGDTTDTNYRSAEDYNSSAEGGNFNAFGFCASPTDGLSVEGYVTRNPVTGGTSFRAMYTEDNGASHNPNESVLGCAWNSASNVTGMQVSGGGTNFIAGSKLILMKLAPSAVGATGPQGPAGPAGANNPLILKVASVALTAPAANLPVMACNMNADKVYILYVWGQGGDKFAIHYNGDDNAANYTGSNPFAGDFIVYSTNVAAASFASSVAISIGRNLTDNKPSALAFDQYSTWNDGSSNVTQIQVFGLNGAIFPAGTRAFLGKFAL